MVCFWVFVESLFDDGYVCIFVLLVVWVRCPALGALAIGCDTGFVFLHEKWLV